MCIHLCIISAPSGLLLFSTFTYSKFSSASSCSSSSYSSSCSYPSFSSSSSSTSASPPSSSYFVLFSDSFSISLQYSLFFLDFDVCLFQLMLVVLFVIAFSYFPHSFPFYCLHSYALLFLCSLYLSSVSSPNRNHRPFILQSRTLFSSCSLVSFHIILSPRSTSCSCLPPCLP